MLKIVPKDFHINVNLLLTRRCNYSCGHCMYAAGPKLPGAYMSIDVVDQILDAMEQIKEELALLDPRWANHTVDYNLVGGEPTLDLEQFGSIIQYMHLRGCDLEMTTNGWWLENPKTLSGFLRALGPAAWEEGLSIRVSDSPFHAPFRSTRLTRLLKHLKQGSDGAQDLLDILQEDSCVVCPECNTKVMREDIWDHHQSCGVAEAELWDEWDRQVGSALPGDAEYRLVQLLNDQRLHVDTQSGDASKISPVGRARGNHIAAAQDGPCGPDSHAVRFTFQPDGSIYDFCCNGGKVAGGHARDGSQLLYNHLSFMEYLYQHFPQRPHSYTGASSNSPWGGGRCRQCSTVAREWKDRLNMQRGAETRDQEVFTTN